MLIARAADGPPAAAAPAAAPPPPPPPAAVAEALARRYPGRGAQIALLARELTAARVAAGTFFVHGPPSAGKTAVVRELLEALGLRHAYVSAAEVSRPRQLFAPVLAQLRGAKRRRADGFAPPGARCDSAADFLAALPGAAAAAAAAAPGGAAWVVLDRAERLAGGELLAALLRARDATGANVGVVLISALRWDTGAFSCGAHGVPPPLQVAFPAYSPDELATILDLERSSAAPDAPPEQYRAFLRFAMPSLARATNDLLDLRAAAAALWPRYAAPPPPGRPATAAAAAARVKRDLQRMTSELKVAPAAAAAAPAASAGPAGAPPPEADAEGSARRADARASTRGLPLELPYAAKFLLLAAHVASRNRPATDRSVFDPSFGRGRGRRDARASDRAAEAAAEAGLRGPHAFPMERLLHFFYAMYAAAEGEGGEGEGERAGARGWADEAQAAEVQMAVTSLVALRLLGASTAGDALEAATYTSNVPDDLAEAVAANVKLRLGDFLSLS
jgi:origin recognition complex subunit 5